MMMHREFVDEALANSESKSMDELSPQYIDDGSKKIRELLKDALQMGNDGQKMMCLLESLHK